MRDFFFFLLQFWYVLFLISGNNFLEIIYLWLNLKEIEILKKKLLYIVTRQMLGFIEMFIFEKKKKEGERTAGNIKKP